MLELSPNELGILALSLRVAIVSVICSLPIAILVAYGLARLSFPGKTLVDAIVHLPLVLPPVVVGFALLVLLGKRGPIGSVLDEWFGIVFAFRWTGAALASALMGFPLMVRAIRLSIDSPATTTPSARSATLLLATSAAAAFSSTMSRFGPRSPCRHGLCGG